MSIYLICIYFLVSMLVAISAYFCFVLFNNKKNQKVTLDNLKEKKSTLYIKYDIKSKDIIINNYTYLTIDVSKSIVDISKNDNFLEDIKRISKDPNEKIFYSERTGDTIFNFWFYYRDTIDDYIILRCDYAVDKVVNPINLKSLDDLKEIHGLNENKNGVLFYLNIKDFSVLNQRYGQQCGDYILEVVKSRLLKIEKSNLHCSYLGADQFAIYYGKKVNKKRAISIIRAISRKLSKPIDIGYINIELTFGVGVCVGDYESLDDFVKCSYIASEYAKKRKKYNIVIYNENMKSEEHLVELCEKEIDYILQNNEINITYNPVFYYRRSKFVGYISKPVFSDKSITYDKLKDVADQSENKETMISQIIDQQLINYLKRRPKKSAKLFLNLRLEDLSAFLETYFSNRAYSDCKIVICLNVKKGYEMINKFPYISSNISKIVEEGIEFATEINYSNMYDYEYILRNSRYLILDENIVSNMNNSVERNMFTNILELANAYELKLFATGVKEYIQMENLLKYDVSYFSGSYFGKGGRMPNEIEQSKTKVFTKFLKDSKKNEKN